MEQEQRNQTVRGKKDEKPLNQPEGKPGQQGCEQGLEDKNRQQREPTPKEGI